MKILAILVGKIIILIGKIFHKGSSLPGKVALKIYPDLLKNFQYPSIRIVVTGSSGKGSTTKLIAETIKNTKTVCYNSSGANLSWGITTALLEHASLNGHIKTDALVLEVDERYTKTILPYIKPDYLVITNLTKDQPPRQHYIDLVYDDIVKSIPKNSLIITNMDDPYLRNFAKDLKNKIVYYSLAKNKYSYKKQIFENLNIYHCPYCNSKLKYSYYNIETLGNYKCPNCSFTYEEPQYIGKNLDLTKMTFTINNEIINIGGDMLYNAYNTLASYTCLAQLNLDFTSINNSLNNLNKLPSKDFINDNKTFRAISCKAENASTYNQAIFKVMHDQDKKDIIIGWLEISRRYNHYDISWLYDIEFELLNNSSLNKIYVCGIDALNIKQRLLLANIKNEKIVMGENIASIKEKVLHSKASKVYGILNFDYVKPFEEAFKKKEE